MSVFSSANCRTVNWVRTMEGNACRSISGCYACYHPWGPVGNGQEVPVARPRLRVSALTQYHFVLVHTLDQATRCARTSSKERVCPLQRGGKHYSQASRTSELSRKPGFPLEEHRVPLWWATSKISGLGFGSVGSLAYPVEDPGFNPHTSK